MIEYGYDSGEWMSRAVIANVDPRMLRLAVLDLVSHLHNAEVDHFHAYDLMDRLLQVAVTGRYTPPADDVFTSLNKAAQEISDAVGRYSSGEDRPLTADEQAILDEFVKGMSDAPEAEDPMKDFKLDDPDEDK